MRSGLGLSLMGVGMAMCAPVVAQDRMGYQDITAGHYAQAAKRIEAERRIFPNRPELMLNLAVAYARSGRTAEASALYQTVLDRPEVAMDLPNGSVASSYDLAKRGLSRLPATATSIAAR